MDAHALPPQLTDAIFVINTLVRPLAVQWVEDIYDPLYKSQPSEVSNGLNNTDDLPNDGFILDELDRIIEDDEAEQHISTSSSEPEPEQANSEDRLDDETELVRSSKNEPVLPSKVEDTYLFTTCGRKFKTDSIAKLLGEFSQKHLGVRLTFTAWCHVIIAIEHEHLLIQDPNELPKDTFFTSQRAHSIAVALAYHALRDDDRNLVSSDSFEKYIKASECLHRWFNREKQPKNQIEQIVDDIHETKGVVQAMKGQMEALQTQLDQMTSEAGRLREDVAGLRQDLANSLKANERLLSMLERKMDLDEPVLHPSLWFPDIVLV
ncbi:hypothetical protein FRC06_008508 [Ceratobasidium sp. 370]|nr:hypothetical protein FRC06_008508 [Ceratobasidium sp. 370]